MKILLSIIIFASFGCAQKPVSTKSLADKDLEIAKLNKEVSALKTENQKICWKAIKQTCQHEFKCVERGVKVCEKLNEKK